MLYFSVLNLLNLTDLSKKKKKDVQNANPELHRDGICRDQPTVILWQQQISDLGSRSRESWQLLQAWT